MDATVEGNVELPEDFEVRFNINDEALAILNDLYVLDHQAVLNYATRDSKAEALKRIRDELVRAEKKVPEFKAQKIRLEKQLVECLVEQIAPTVTPEQCKLIGGDIGEILTLYLQRDSEPDFKTKEVVLKGVKPEFFFAFKEPEKKDKKAKK